VVVLRTCKYADIGLDAIMSEKYILRIVENAGEMLAKNDDTNVAVPTEPLLEDMKRHLLFTPKRYLWTIGWRTYVWQEKETGKFQELSESEWAELSSVGTVSYSRDDDGSSDAVGDSTPDEGVSAQ
jgi:hypothetical protein